jgi:hypothetical protein
MMASVSPAASQQAASVNYEKEQQTNSSSREGISPGIALI